MRRTHFDKVFRESRHYNELAFKNKCTNYIGEDNDSEQEKIFQNKDVIVDEDKLECKLSKHVARNINRVRAEIQNTQIYRKYNPTSLRSRVAMLDEGSYHLNKVENASMYSHIEDEKNVDQLMQNLARQSSFQFTILLSLIQTTTNILSLTLNQWQQYMKGNDTWMGSFVLEDGTVDDYAQRPNLALAIFKKSILLVQQVRSHHLSRIMKDDLWDSKHLFRNEVKRFILVENHQTQTMDELVHAVVEQIKEWIRREKPHINDLDVAWQKYVQRQISNLKI